MTDDEIRIKIAKLKGYTFWDSLDKLGPWAKKGNPSSASYAGGIPLYKVESPKPDRVTWDDDDPNWPGDIGAAWELVEEMAEYSMQKSGREVVAFLYPMKDSLKGFVGKSETPARAICLAYIAWKGETAERP